jgi:hypothetical protein
MLSWGTVPTSFSSIWHRERWWNPQYYVLNIYMPTYLDKQFRATRKKERLAIAPLAFHYRSGDLIAKIQNWSESVRPSRSPHAVSKPDCLRSRDCRTPRLHRPPQLSDLTYDVGTTQSKRPKRPDPSEPTSVGGRSIEAGFQQDRITKSAASQHILASALTAKLKANAHVSRFPNTSTVCMHGNEQVCFQAVSGASECMCMYNTGTISI